MQRGQASLEYVGVVALVAVMLALAVTLTPAPDLAGAVGAQVRRALCLVGGGDCLSGRRPEPCVVRAEDRSAAWSAHAWLLRLHDGRDVLVEERSDGSATVTVTQAEGVQGGIAGNLRLPFAGHDTHVGLELTAGAHAAYGRSYVRPDVASARSLVAWLDEHDPPLGGVTQEGIRRALGRREEGPSPDSRTIEVGGDVSASAALRLLHVGPQAAAVADLAGSVSVDAHTGERTVALRLDEELTAGLSARLADLSLGVPSAASVAVTFDRTGRPARLTLLHHSGKRGAVRVPGHAAQTGDRVEVEARLDLADPVVRREALAALHGDAAAIARTAQRLRETSRLDVRIYETSRGERSDVRLAGLVEHALVTERSRLVSALGYEPGLGWSHDLDCELAA